MKHWGLVLLLCLGWSSAWAQKVQVFDAPGTPNANRGATQPSMAPTAVAPQPAPATSPPVETTTELNAENAKAAEPELTPQQKDLLAVSEALNKGTTFFALIRDPVLRPKLINAYQENPMSNIPETVVDSMVTAQMNNSGAGKWLLKNVPQSKKFLVEFIRDPVAFGRMLQSLNRMEDFVFYIEIAIVIYLALYFLRRQILFGVESKLKRAAIQLGFTAVFYGGFYLWMSSEFGEYFEPMFVIFSKHFL